MSARDVEAAHFAAEVFAAINQLARDDAFGEDAAFVIDVVEKEIERGDALRQAAVRSAPIHRRE